MVQPHTMESTQSSAMERPLPDSLESIKDIMDMPTDRLKKSPVVNVLGFLRDFRPPFKTRGTDFKCTLQIIDVSTQFEPAGIQIVIFRPEDKMPKLNPGAGDIFLFRKMKVQMWSGNVSLLCTWGTEIFHLSRTDIPLPSKAVAPLLWKSDPPKAKCPTTAESNYAVWANSTLDRTYLPTGEEFQERSMQATNIKDKFGLLKDVQPGKFYNIIGNVVQVFDAGGDFPLTLYLSDYTPNSLFYNYSWASENEPLEGVDGDEYGYLSRRPKKTKDWPGPFGKLVIQINVYDQHADYIRENVKVDQWIMLRNLYINFGKAGGCLEGFQRGEQNQASREVKVDIMQVQEEPDDNSVRWKEAVGRKRAWWTKFEKQKKEFQQEETPSGLKRKRDGDEGRKLNGKERRKEKRAAAKKKALEADAKVAKRLDLNENVRCNHPDKPALSLLEIKKSHQSKSANGQRYQLPFVNCNYRADVRVVDFSPNRLEDFAVGRRVSEYDMLSDYSGGEDTDHEEDMRKFREGKGFGEKKWEWRFALQVEDASENSSSSPRERMWLLVQHKDAEMLLGIDENATNLRRDPDTLSRVREKLCILWGDLEEQKLASLPNVTSKEEDNMPASSIESSGSTALSRKVGDQPDVDSDIEDTIQQWKSQMRRPLEERSLNSVMIAVEETSIPGKKLAVKNKAFTCCIKQYGIKVQEKDASMATVLNEQRWERVFGLHGTSIM